MFDSFIPSTAFNNADESSAIQVRDKSPRQAGGILRGNNVAATPLPNMFCDIGDLGSDFQSFTGVPDVSISI